MQRQIKPDWLLRQAHDLATSPGSGQPRNADLRRAVSSAYCALFHEISQSLADWALGPTVPVAERLEFTRHVHHAQVNEVCRWIKSPIKQAPTRVQTTVAALQTCIELQDVADAFADLQEARHDADYNHLSNHTRAGTLTLIDSSRNAISTLRSLVDTDHYHRFMSLVLVKSKVSN